MNKRLMLAALAAAGLLATSNANAQIDLGGAVSRAIGQATGNNQAGTTPAPGAQVFRPGRHQRCIACCKCERRW